MSGNEQAAEGRATLLSAYPQGTWLDATALLTGWLVELKLSSRQACAERPQQQQCSLSLFAEFDLPAIQDFFKNSIDYVSLSAYVPQATVDFQVGRCCLPSALPTRQQRRRYC